MYNLILRTLVFLLYVVFAALLGYSVVLIEDDMDEHYTKVQDTLLFISCIHLGALISNAVYCYCIRRDSWFLVFEIEMYPVQPRGCFALVDFALLFVTLWQFSVIGSNNDASLMLLFILLTLTIILCFYKFCILTGTTTHNNDVQWFKGDPMPIEGQNKYPFEV